MKVAVIGGGIFGATAAIRLAKEGHEVTLFEKRADLFQAASGINQYRLHRGYHYPRSDHTIRSCSDSVPLFEEEYSEALIKDIDHFYAIAKEGSLVDGKQFLGVCAYFDLPAKKEVPPFLNRDAVDVVIRGDEYTIDPFLLTKIVKERLQKNNVKVVLNTEARVNELKKNYDYVVIATMMGSPMST
jgi:L-2-hydroxyglutarate oxidase LhgO